MSNTADNQNNGKKPVKRVVTPPELSSLNIMAIQSTVIPPQKSPTDTSNWDNRAFTTPNHRLVIETDQRNNGIVITE
jgi:hypothetical protein